jgi:hypothetical protein
MDACFLIDSYSTPTATTKLIYVASGNPSYIEIIVSWSYITKTITATCSILSEEDFNVECLLYYKDESIVCNVYLALISFDKNSQNRPIFLTKWEHFDVISSDKSKVYTPMTKETLSTLYSFTVLNSNNDFTTLSIPVTRM